MKHLREFISSVPEYRRTGKGNFKHKLEDILMLVIWGRLSKCITRAEIIQFGKHHLKRFQSMGMLLCGIPSEATLYRVSKGIDDEEMAARMSAFVDVFRKELPGGSRIKTATPKDVYTQGPCLEHGRIETRICRIFPGEEFIADKEKWNGRLNVNRGTYRYPEEV